MKMKRVLAKDTRTALAMIKQSLGEDAVILSNNKIAGQVEIVAAVDYDEKRASASTGSAFSDCLTANLDRLKSQRNLDKRPVNPHQVNSNLHADMFSPEPVQRPTHNMATHQTIGSDNMQRMEKELGLLRLLVDQQMSQSSSQHRPFISASALKVAQRLERMGFEKQLVDPLLAQLPAADDADQLWSHAQQWLQDNINTSSQGVVHQPGTYALVGPTGVGKTTAIGKLGAQLAMKHGKHKVALISMDQQRIGARDQLRVFGTMLGIEVQHVAGFTELTHSLNQMAHKDYILIDTSGGNPFDPHIQNVVQGLQGVPQQISIYLTLAANSQSHSLRYLMKHYADKVTGVVATKLDECLPLGGLLTALVESRQPLAMITDGQRIPLDLGYPSAQQLVAHAVEAELAEETGGIEALSKLLHATPGKPQMPRNELRTRTTEMTSNFCGLHDTPVSALGLASYRSH